MYSLLGGSTTAAYPCSVAACNNFMLRIPELIGPLGQLKKAVQILQLEFIQPEEKIDYSWKKLLWELPQQNTLS